MFELSLEELRELLIWTPAMVQMHPLSLAFLSEEVTVFETAEEMVAILDNPEPQPETPMMALTVDEKFSHRFPIVRCRHDPFTTDLNRILLPKLDWVRQWVLYQSQLPEVIVKRASGDCVVLVIVDGLGLADWKRFAPTDFLAMTEPCFVDGISITEHGMKRIVGDPPISVWLAERDYERNFGFSYWERTENELTNQIFFGVTEGVIKVRSFEVVKVFESRGIEVMPLRLNPGDLPPDGWLDLFGIDIATPMGLALYRAVSKLKRSNEHFFTVKDIITEVVSDPLVRETSVQALALRLETAANDWDLFSTRYHDLLDVFKVGAVNVVDLGVLEVGRVSLRNLVVAVLVRDLFRKRREARLREELGIPTQVPKIWLAIDEAQEFVPAGKTALAKEPLIQWVKEGRQPGLSLIIASQQPGAIDKEVLSQCDLILCHKVTAVEDVDAINKLSHDYMAHELRHYIRQLERTGEAVMVDDFCEAVTIVQIRPRKSKHGGAEL